MKKVVIKVFLCFYLGIKHLCTTFAVQLVKHIKTNINV